MIKLSISLDQQKAGFNGVLIDLYHVSDDTFILGKYSYQFPNSFAQYFILSLPTL